MNPFISSQRTEAETTLARERLHWGIFILPLLILLFAAIPEIILINIFKKLFATIEPIGGNTQPQRPFFWLYAMMIFVGAMPGVLALLGAWLSYTKSELLLTSKRLMFRTGFLNKISGELPLENVESIYIAEPLFGRMFGYGTVAVTSVGGAIFPLRYIGSPQQFHSKLQQAVATAKSPANISMQPPHKNIGDGDSRYMPRG